jgi:SAM-dependent methyltransferase
MNDLRDETARREDAPEALEARWLARVSVLLSEPGKDVLDLGCGEGAAARHFADKHHYMGVDRNGEWVRRARDLHPAGTFLPLDYTRLELPQGVVDAVLAYATFDSLEADEIKEVIRRVGSWLRTDGYLLVRVGPRDESSFLEQTVLREANLEAVDRQVVTGGANDQVHGLWLLAQKSPEDAALLTYHERRYRQKLRRRGRKPVLATPPPLVDLIAHWEKRAARGPGTWKRGDGSRVGLHIADRAASEPGLHTSAGAGLGHRAVRISSTSKAIPAEIDLLGYPDGVLRQDLHGFDSLDLRVGAPPIHRFENLIYLPRFDGLFDQDGRRVDEASRPRGPELGELRGSAPEWVDPPVAAKRIDSPVVFCVGLPKHWGVFHTEGISRLWALLDPDLPPGSALLGPKAKWWSSRNHVPFMDRFLSAAGIDADRFLRLETATLLAEVYIPHPSFVLRGQAFTHHAALPEHIAEGICGSTLEHTDQPVYFSRRRLSEARSRVDNEEALEAFLARRGVKIVSPETLSFDDQVRLVNTHSTFIGCIGSAFHTLLYALPGRTVRTIAVTTGSASFHNYLMIDALKQIRARYLYVEPYQRRPGIKLGGRIDGRDVAAKLEELSLIDAAARPS